MTCERNGEWWVLTIPAINGAVTQAANLEQIPFMAAGASEVMGGRLPDTLHLTGGGVVAAFGERPLLEGEALTVALVQGFTPATTDADRRLLAEQVERFGRWTCAADASGVTCARM